MNGLAQTRAHLIEAANAIGDLARRLGNLNLAPGRPAAAIRHEIAAIEAALEPIRIELEAARDALPGPHVVDESAG